MKITMTEIPRRFTSRRLQRQMADLGRQMEEIIDAALLDYWMDDDYDDLTVDELRRREREQLDELVDSLDL